MLGCEPLTLPMTSQCAKQVSLQLAGPQAPRDACNVIFVMIPGWAEQKEEEAVWKIELGPYAACSSGKSPAQPDHA